MSQTISNAIRALVDYAVERKLCQEDDRVYLTNRLLDVMDEDSYEPTDEVFSGDLEVILGTLLDAAVEKGLIEDQYHGPGSVRHGPDGHCHPHAP